MAAIMMVPGLFGNGCVWDEVQRFFEELNFRCYPVTLPLRRKLTEVPDPELGKIGIGEDINSLRTQIAEVKKTLKPNECFIGMAHSRGTFLILMLQQQQIFAERRERLFDRIVLVVPAPPKGIKALSWSGLKGYLSLRPRYWFLGRPVKRTFAGMAYAVMEENMPIYKKMAIYKSLSWESGRVVAETLFSPLPIEVEKINCPVLVIGASQDRLVPQPIARKIAVLFKAEYRKIDGPHFLLKGPACRCLCETIRNWIWGV